MKATYKSQHRNNGKRNPTRKGQLDYIYSVSGTPQELEDFKVTQKEFWFDDENGVALLSSPRDLGASAPMVKRQSDGRWIPIVDEKAVAIGKLAKLAGQFPMFSSQFGAEAAAIAIREEARANAAVVAASVPADTAKL